MRLTACLLFCLAMALTFSGPASAGESAFDAAQDLYAAGEYDKALELFLKVDEAGEGTPALFYNLGNTCLRLDRLGPAVYWYEKAAQGAPGDTDIAFNLAYARSLMVDRQEDGKSPLHQVLFFLDGQVSPLAIELLFLVLAGCGWLCLGLGPAMKQPALKQAAWTLFFLALLVAPSAVYSQYRSHVVDRGVILPDELDVRAGLSGEATTLFTLHAGSRVVIDDTRQGWLRIRFGEDKIGWVPEGEVGRL